MKMIYFDYCATTPLDKQVAALMGKVNEHVFGNPSSVHRFGQEARSCVERARRQLSKAINCEPSEIIFTGSGSEANNLALWNVLHGDRKHLVISPIEHPSVTDTAEKLQELGVSVTVLEVDSYGVVNTDDVSRAIQDNTGLVSIMMANNETGTLEPVREIAQVCSDARVPFHTDAVQALGKVPIDVHKFKVTSMSFSAHKLYGPKGVGALYVEKGTKLHPHTVGGGQEQRLRGGTENVSGIAAFGLAVELAVSQLEKEATRLDSLRDLFLEKTKAETPEVIVNGHPEMHLPGVMSISFPGVPADALLMNLDLEGLAVSSGSACSSGSTQPSRVLKAMGIPDDLNRRTLRVSFGRYTKKEDVDTLVRSMAKHVGILRQASEEMVAA